MKNMGYILILSFFCLQASVAMAASKTMTKYDHANLLKAIEDYRFNDLENATATLEKLHQRFPKNLRVIHYLGLAYQEAMHFQKAITTFKRWLELSKDTTSDKSRFAWMGIARSEIGLTNYWESVRSIKGWLKHHPDDIQAYLMLGDVLIRAESFAQADSVFEGILNNPQARRGQKAAAFYYKAWSAFLNGDMKAMKSLVTKSLALDAEGPYATPARNLLTTPPSKILGFVGMGSAEVFYNSNVELLPDVVKSTGGESDTGIQSNLMLGWAMRKLDLNYVFSGTFYQTRTDFNLLLHSLSATWSEKSWAFIPSYEHVSLNDAFLYEGYGLGVRYHNKGWVYQYTGKAKVFSDAYGLNLVDLTRLGGSSHVLSVQKGVKIKGIHTVFSSEATSELTKGDASHNQTDSYIQFGGSVLVQIPMNKEVNSTVTFKTSIRQYSAADTAALVSPTDNTVRSDIATQLATSTTWKPWGTEADAVIFNLTYQSNASNYDEGVVPDELSKSYTSFKAGVLYSSRW
ncbi:MAG: hypothetical protein Q9M19_02895 [Mariprofundaceae bacterium]|nr:hypothetical protein [Mariprofundaceae bacterium]